MEGDHISVRLSHVDKNYYIGKMAFPALRDVSLSFPNRGLIAILGESGSGKTTLLNIIGGLDHATGGEVFVNEQSTKSFKPSDWDDYRNKRIGFVFQSYNLIAHYSVLQNVELAPRLAGLSKEQRRDTSLAVLEKVGLKELAKKRPNQLSGGQMQRVAIARALANDPEIILADEPTGALDTQTSLQVMELLKEISKEHCVILVTHNETLANAYAERIIRMSDGRVSSDSAPLEDVGSVPEVKAKKKAGMSLLTLINSSFQSVKSKKGRTALTAVACSIGIIGIALVLATSNGFSGYVSRVETSVASSVPISISPTIYSFNSKIVEDYSESAAFPSDNKVRVYDTSSNAFVAHRNEFTPEYFDYLQRVMDDPTCEAYGTAMSIMKNRDGFSMHMLALDGDTEKVKEINTYSSAGTLGSAISSVANLPATVMHELYGDEKSMSSAYDVLAGHYPKEKDEMVLIIDRFNRVEMGTLRKLGILHSSANYETMEGHTIDFSDILYEGLGDAKFKQYKCYRTSDYYRINDIPSRTITRDSWEDISYNLLQGRFVGTESTAELTVYPAQDIEDVYANDDIFHPVNCKIVGILRPTKESYLSLMPTSIGYLPSLTEYLVEDISEGGAGKPIADAQKENWFIARNYLKDSEGEFVLDDDGNKTIDTVNDGLCRLNNAFEELKKVLETQGTEGEDSVSSTTITNAFNKVPTVVWAYAYFDEGTTTYLYNASSSSYFSLCRNYGVELKRIDSSLLKAETLLAKLITKGFFSDHDQVNFIDLLGFIQAYSAIKAVLVFPKSLTTKEALVDYLNKWNEGKADSESIYFNDVMSTFTDSIGMIVSVISAVLITFASISLVVSSVMTAIITYISVIERTKEIGVLRACGARKRDVGRLFESECLFVGLFAGAIGVALSYLICIPINAILNANFPTYNLGQIAMLHPLHGLLLLGIAAVLGLLSGLVPSRLAARKDPVICLRSE